MITSCLSNHDNIGNLCSIEQFKYQSGCEQWAEYKYELVECGKVAMKNVLALQFYGAQGGLKVVIYRLGTLGQVDKGW